MSSRIENRVVLGSLRYKSATNTNLLFQVPLVQTAKENIEFDRTITIQLEQIYDDERQSSTVFRPISKLSLLFENQYLGKTKYYPFSSSLYFVNVEDVASLACKETTGVAPSYSGLPQFYEFDFMRPDNNISGYTTPDSSNNYHVYFENRSATTYNWGVYMSYPYDNNTTQLMSAFDSKSNNVLTWTVSDGIPFVISRTTSTSQLVISFRCPAPHGLSVGEYVKLSFKYNGEDKFQVYSLGDEYYDSGEYIFNVYDVGYTGTTFNDGTTGTFKRIINIDNENETTSEYYVRKHKIITEEDYPVLTKSGFEQQIFNKIKKRQKGAYSPNKQSRVAVKEGNTVYNLSFNEDIDIKGLRDNHYRPLTELFYTIIWKGYMGWTFGVSNPSGGYYGLKKGWGFNIPPAVFSAGTPSSWWDNTNGNSDVGLPLDTYTTPLGIPNRPFTYIKPLKVGDTIDGDYCEWNNYEQVERVISDMYHKFKFNPYYFNIGVLPSASFGNSTKGYYYKPHNPITIRMFSDYLEEGSNQNVVGIPDYAFYSDKEESFIWRDLYPYGYVDSSGIGVDYPFLNGKHYPYREIVFRLIGEGSNYSNTNNINNNVVPDPTTDNCE
jgi:hypothetical protein